MRRLLLTAVAVVALSSCAPEADGGDGRVRAVGSFYPLAEVIRQVGGDAVAVTDLTPPGAEPHDLELTTRQVDALLDADLVVVLGGGFQPAVEDVADDRDGATLAVGDGGDDPHLWLDPLALRDIVHAVADALVEIDPDHVDAYRDGASRYGAELDALHADFERGLASCTRNIVVTSHDAFGRLTARYGLVQEPIAGIEPGQEPDARRLGELADLVGSEGITTIFTETLVSPAVAEALAREAGVAVAVLDPLEGLADEDGDYLSVMRDNLAALQRALDC